MYWSLVLPTFLCQLWGTALLAEERPARQLDKSRQESTRGVVCGYLPFPSCRCASSQDDLGTLFLTICKECLQVPSHSKADHYVLLTWFSSVFLSCASIDVLSEYIAHLPNPTFMAQGVCWRNALPWLPWHDVTWHSFLGPPGVTRPDLSGLRNRAVQWFSPCYPPMWLLEEHRRKSFARQATRFKARMS